MEMYIYNTINNTMGIMPASEVRSIIYEPTIGFGDTHNPILPWLLINKKNEGHRAYQIMGLDIIANCTPDNPHSDLYLVNGPDLKPLNIPGYIEIKPEYARYKLLQVNLKS